MFSISERFKFLKDSVDFPFYNNNPKLSSHDWLLMLGSVIMVLAILFIIEIPEGYGPLSLFIVTVIPALYFCKGDYSLFFKKPKLRDF